MLKPKEWCWVAWELSQIHMAEVSIIEWLKNEVADPLMITISSNNVLVQIERFCCFWQKHVFFVQSYGFYIISSNHICWVLCHIISDSLPSKDSFLNQSKIWKLTNFGVLIKSKDALKITNMKIIFLIFSLKFKIFYCLVFSIFFSCFLIPKWGLAFFFASSFQSFGHFSFCFLRSFVP